MDVDFIASGGRLQRVQDLARDASKAGFSGIVFAEAGRTAYLSVAAAALATNDLDLSTGIAVAFPRSPMITAKIAWELADASAGRFTLGLGPQVKAHIERRYGVGFDPPAPVCASTSRRSVRSSGRSRGRRS
ncbi:MAG: LLM class flavin-dependent oxidoreductase [Acidimicrobiia bacterium]